MTAELNPGMIVVICYFFFLDPRTGTFPADRVTAMFQLC